jgi:alpha-beta hydrolase superfamily lysophospholipase
MKATALAPSAFVVVVVLTGSSACTPECVPVPPGSLGALTAREDAFLADGGLPAPPERQFVVAEDGLPLAYLDMGPAVPDDEVGAAALVVHGSSAHGALYTALGAGLASRGIAARLIDLRGHGFSRCSAPGVCGDGAAAVYDDDGAYFVGRAGDAADDAQLSRDLDLHLQALRARFPVAALYLVGHSSGAGLVSRFVETGGPRDLAGLVLMTPFHHADQPQNTLLSFECGRVVGTDYARVDLGAVGDARRGNVHRYVLSLDKPEALSDPLDTLRYTFTMMQGLAVVDPTSFAESLHLPTLWIAAREDALLNLEASQAEFDRIPGGVDFVVVDASHVGVSWLDDSPAAIAAFMR